MIFSHTWFLQDIVTLPCELVVATHFFVSISHCCQHPLLQGSNPFSRRSSAKVFSSGEATSCLCSSGDSLPEMCAS
jgi:hypothetical protein